MLRSAVCVFCGPPYNDLAIFAVLAVACVCMYGFCFLFSLIWLLAIYAMYYVRLLRGIIHFALRSFSSSSRQPGHLKSTTTISASLFWPFYCGRLSPSGMASDMRSLPLSPRRSFATLADLMTSSPSDLRHAPLLHHGFFCTLYPSVKSRQRIFPVRHWSPSIHSGHISFSYPISRACGGGLHSCPRRRFLFLSSFTVRS